MLKVHNVDTGTLCLEVSAVAGRPSHFSTSSDAISPLSPTCSCPSLEWFPFLDWTILHEHFPGPCTGSSLVRHTLSQLRWRDWLSPPWNLFKHHLVRSFFLNMYLKMASFFDSLYYICFIFVASVTIGHTSYCFLFASLLHNWILEFLFFRKLHLLDVQCLVFVSIQDKFLKYVKEFLIKNLNTWCLEEKLAN